ncbi:MAG: hypothetical protein Q7T04_07905 [Dehalococcoidia bacterium]|nr:hypothetical protein [Dehalococcoidia bacterium]
MSRRASTVQGIARRQGGSILIETLVALALLGLLGATFLPAVSTSAKTAGLTEEMVNMDNLARAQMEYTKNSAYVSGSPDVTSYPRVDDPVNPNAVVVPDGYSVAVVGHALNQPDNGIQEVTVTVHRGAKSTSLKGYKVNR